MKTIKHKFLEHQINPNTEILIIGTFNPDTEKNEVDFFYGRNRNYLWRLLPTALNYPDLKGLSKQQKLSFIEHEHIDFIDLIAKIEVEKGQEDNYNDSFIDCRVVTWQKVIIQIEKLSNLKKILFTRKTFTCIPNIKNKIEIIQDYCSNNGIYFKALITPSRYYNENKQTKWTNFFNKEINSKRNH
jgi:G:T/U-mismatch repair DNA glycosylase